MKKLIVLFFCFALVACVNKYHNLGYNNTQVSVINSLSDDDKLYFDEYSEQKASLLENKNFKEENLDLYKLFIKYIDGDKCVDLVNAGIISEKNYGLVKRLSAYDDFNVDNLKAYLERLIVIDDEQTAIKVVNEDIKANVYLIKRLSSDPYYILDNLNEYIKYYSKDKTTRENVEYVNTLSYLTYFEDNFYSEPEKYGVLVNVNKFYYLGETYNPDDLVELGDYGYGSLRKVAYDAFVKMSDDAKKEGVIFYATSSYRSYETQVKVYNRYLAIDEQSVVDTYSARPGFSDHQSGYTVDILKKGYDFDTFYQTDASQWLANNAYKYGFICRYPEGKDAVTGYKYEPWHYRYVGVEAASFIQETKITYDEYFAKFVKEQ